MHTDFPMELITGIEKIDLQHMELIARIKMLHESYLNETNTEKLIETLGYIRCYIDEHFATEEKYMTELNYPHYDRHLKAHKEFAADYLKLENLFKREGTSSDFSLDFNVRLIDWLKDHVFNEDIVMANFIREKEAVSKEKDRNNETY
jgi:hemerythrin